MATLKELLGEAYKEGMTHEEIDAVLASKNLADLSSGKYVSKDKAEREKTEAIKALEESKKAEGEKSTKELSDRIAALEREKAQLEYSKKLEASGIDTKYLSFVQSQVPMDDNFDKNIEKFKADNPAFCKVQEKAEDVKFTKFGGQQGKALDDEGTLLDALKEEYENKK